ncbi:diacylglycerol kinase family lipid kinase [Anaerotignum faecicola]|nr:diacylglycerol kinase family lipid kinase [Anaerotignum faecicola]
MPEKILFVFNPNSGKGTIKNHIFQIVDVFTKNGCIVTVYPTSKHGDGEKIIGETGGQYKKILISGGDGTLNECINGLLSLPAEVRPCIGYIPSGSTNDFASSLKIPKNPSAAIKNIIEGAPIKFDVGKFNDSCFVYIAAFGAFTDVAYATPQNVKNYIGHMAYILEGIKRLPTIKSCSMEIEHDGDTVKGSFIYGMVSNSSYVGGLKTYRFEDIDMSDGLFECVFIKAPETPIELQSIITGLLMKDFSSPEFCNFRTHSLTIKSAEKISWTLDGEYGGKHSFADIKNVNNAVSIFTVRR